MPRRSARPSNVSSPPPAPTASAAASSSPVSRFLRPEGADRTPRLISAFQRGPIGRKRRGDRDIPDWLVCSDWHGERGPILPCVLSAEQAGCDQTLSAAWRARTRACACVCALARHVRPRACASRTDAAGRGAAPGSARDRRPALVPDRPKTRRILVRYFFDNKWIFHIEFGAILGAFSGRPGGGDSARKEREGGAEATARDREPRRAQVPGRVNDKGGASRPGEPVGAVRRAARNLKRTTDSCRDGCGGIAPGAGHRLDSRQAVGESPVTAAKVREK